MFFAPDWLKSGMGVNYFSPVRGMFYAPGSSSYTLEGYGNSYSEAGEGSGGGGNGGAKGKSGGQEGQDGSGGRDGNALGRGRDGSSGTKRSSDGRESATVTQESDEESVGGRGERFIQGELRGVVEECQA